MNLARTFHLHSLPTDDVSGSFSTDRAIFNQIGAEWPARAASCRVFRNAKAWRKHPAKRCRFVIAIPLKCEEKNTMLIYTRGVANSKQCASIQFCSVDGGA